jgi:multiple sugar transport system permease protein
MDTFVADTVETALPELEGELERAFARSRRPPPSRLVRTVLPVAAIALLGALLTLYIVWVRRTRAEPSARGRAAGLAGYGFLAPWLIGFTVFLVGPIVAAMVLSLTRWNMIKPPEWVGLQHYLGLLGDRHFGVGLRRTFLYVALVVPISLAGGLFTAGLLTCRIRGREAFKAIFYFPSLFTGAAAAVLWLNMFNKEYGVVNRLLGAVGVAPVSWLDEGHAFFTVVLMNVFWVGGAMIIYYAGMRQIPDALYESAEIDGAGPVRRFLHVTIPMLSPVILFMVVMTTIGAFQVFTPALFFAASSTQIGEPGDALRFYSVNIYDEAFNNLNMGRACCYALILFLIIFAVTMLQMRLSRRFVYTETRDGA